MSWIKASESLPTEICHCLVFTETNTLGWAFFNSHGKFCAANSYYRNVTHWMPLPAPPTAADSGAGANSTQQAKECHTAGQGELCL